MALRRLLTSAPLTVAALRPGLRVFRWRGFVQDGRFLSRSDPLPGTVVSVGPKTFLVRFDDDSRRRYAHDELALLQRLLPAVRAKGDKRSLAVGAS